ncbi:MAG: DUF2157 domain-containing protein [Kineosporiaceae bacterium]|nr:DUF2157 domain-containing protein [Kineosporiaceae bacterium]
MTEGLSAGPADPVAPEGTPVSRISPGQYAWLDQELAAWRAQGLVSEPAERAIRSRYVADRRLSLITVVSGLGAAFVASGVIWLVAANLDRLSPVVRFTLVAAGWLGLVALAEALAARVDVAAHPTPSTAAGVHAVANGAPLLGAVRLLAAAAFGAVVFQAAQSLQVPAYRASLMGWWALGALLYAYAVSGRAPLVLAVATGAIWFVWQSAQDGAVRELVPALLLAAAVASSVAVGHTARWRAGFAGPWRVGAAALTLLGLFLAALPWLATEGLGSPTGTLIAGAVVAALAVVAAGLVGDRLDRTELAVTVAAGLAGIGLSAWTVPSSELTEAGELSADVTARAVVAVLVFLLIAGALAVIGTRRDLTGLTWLATGSLVVFTTVQSFAVFAPIISGATLFLAVGLVLLVSGYGVDRFRRRLVTEFTPAGLPSPEEPEEPGKPDPRDPGTPTPEESEEGTS